MLQLCGMWRVLFCCPLLLPSIRYFFVLKFQEFCSFTLLVSVPRLLRFFAFCSRKCAHSVTPTGTPFCFLMTKTEIVSHTLHPGNKKVPNKISLNNLVIILGNFKIILLRSVISEDFNSVWWNIRSVVYSFFLNLAILSKSCLPIIELRLLSLHGV